MAARLLRAARADIREIAGHIAGHDRLAARRWESTIRRRLADIDAMPGIGAPRSWIRPGLRLLPVGTCNILYEVRAGEVVVVRVLHHARAWQGLV